MRLDITRKVLVIVLEGHGEHRDGPGCFVRFGDRTEAVDVFDERADSIVV